VSQAFHQSFLEFRNHRYLKLAALLSLGSTVAYLQDPSALGHYGGTKIGIGLGTVGAALILWLMWFGVRKRRYSSRMGTLQGWLSAHVYLGGSLLVVATLHTGLQGGWNVHTAAYVLMLMVMASGCYGIYAYVRFPTLMTEVMGDETLDGIFLKVPGLDMEARRLALNLPDDINQAVLKASQESRVGGGVWAQMTGVDRKCPTAAAVRLVSAKGRTLQGADARRNHELFAVLLRKQSLLERARQSVMYKARLDLWLYAHVPLSFALLATLAAHVFSVFFYRA
jgi:hypothetical protein